jgi:hypothetical protein
MDWQWELNLTLNEKKTSITQKKVNTMYSLTKPLHCFTYLESQQNITQRQKKEVRIYLMAAKCMLQHSSVVGCTRICIFLHQ